MLEELRSVATLFFIIVWTFCTKMTSRLRPNISSDDDEMN